MKEVHQVKIIIKRNDKYLLLKKVTATFKEHIGCWEVPGGKLEPEETPQQGAIREIKEETTLPIKIISEFPPFIYTKDGTTVHTTIYLATTPTKKINLSKEHSDAVWTTIENVDKLSNVLFKEELKKYLREAERI